MENETLQETLEVKDNAADSEVKQEAIEATVPEIKPDVKPVGKDALLHTIYYGIETLKTASILTLGVGVYYLADSVYSHAKEIKAQKQCKEYDFPTAIEKIPEKLDENFGTLIEAIEKNSKNVKGDLKIEQLNSILGIIDKLEALKERDEKWMQRYSDVLNQFKQVEEENNKLSENLNRKTREVQDLEDKYSSLEEDYGLAGETMDELFKQKTAALKQVQLYNKLLQDAEQAKIDIKKETDLYKALIKNAEDEKIEMLIDLDQAQKRVNQLEEENRQLEDQLSENEKAVDEFQENEKQLKEKIKALQDKDDKWVSRYANVVDEFNELVIDLKQAQKKVTNLEEELEFTISKHRRMRDIIVENLNSVIRQNKRLLKQLEESKDNCDLINETLGETLAREEVCEEEKEEKDKLIKEQEETINSLKNKVQEQSKTIKHQEDELIKVRNSAVQSQLRRS